jgi:hypothetical protein
MNTNGVSSVMTISYEMECYILDAIVAFNAMIAHGKDVSPPYSCSKHRKEMLLAPSLSIKEKDLWSGVL